MKQEPLVSIITPTFNRANLVVEAIQSVLKQSYQTWEMLIWDDGSSDATPQIIPTIRDSRITYRRGPNRGQAFARNQAMARARGRYIAFLDDDDRWLPDKLARQVQILERHGEADVLFSNFQNMDLVNGSMRLSFDANREILNQLKTRQLESGVYLISEGFAESLSRRNFVLPSSLMMRRGWSATVGPFNEALRGTEDKEYWWRCALQGARFAYVEDVLLIRRKGEDSFSTAGACALHEDIKALNCCLRIAERLGRSDLVPAVRRTIGTVWEDLIRFRCSEGKPWSAFEAFWQRCHYGITGRAVALTICSVCGPAILRLARKTKHSERGGLE